MLRRCITSHTGTLYKTRARQHQTRKCHRRHSIFTQDNNATTANQHNNTPLHIIACQAIPKNIIEFINTSPANQIAAMALTTNNHGKTPIDLIQQLSLNDHDREAIESTLYAVINHWQQTHVKPLTAPIDTNEVLQKYSVYRNKELNENLTLACQVVNQIRKYIKSSATHPDTNAFTQAKQNEIRTITQQLGKRYQDEFYIRNFNTEFSLLKTHQTMVCSQLALAAIYCLNEFATQPFYAQVANIANGNHSFLIFYTDDSLAEELKYPWMKMNYHTYAANNKNILFCDPWSGTVGQLNDKDMVNNLGGFMQHHFTGASTLNMITTFNPAYHQLTTTEYHYHINPAKQFRL